MRPIEDGKTYQSDCGCDFCREPEVIVFSTSLDEFEPIHICFECASKVVISIDDHIFKSQTNAATNPQAED